MVLSVPSEASPFTRGTFFGSSVSRFTASIGWNEQQSQLAVDLVDDPQNGDAFQWPLPGTPGYFKFYGFHFFGLVKERKRTRDQGGDPVYRVVLQDPREILAGTQVVLGDYYGTVGTVKNLLNPFGYWENGVGFGSSQTNEAGMPWNKVRAALSTMCNIPGGTAWGGPLMYRGYAYSLDLSEIPVPPPYYRIGPGHATLMELISSICQDGACDYFVELDGYTIKIRTVSRLRQPPLGTISALANTNWGNVVRTEDGLEGRQDVTSSFLVGGPQQTLYQTDNIQPFWGFDTNGKPILGQGSGIYHAMNLNAMEVADIVGGTSYPCTVFELCCALSNYESWSCYMISQRPNDAAFIGVISPNVNAQVGAAIVMNGDIKNATKLAAQAAGSAQMQTLQNLKNDRMYQFVRKAASEFMGKKFLVGLPFILSATDAETLQIHYSQEPCDAGFLPDGATPLGLPALVEDQFQTQDGRYQPFALYAQLVGLDLSKVYPGEVALGQDGLYMKATVENRIVFTPAPMAIMSVSSPLYVQPYDGLGDSRLVALILSGDPGQVQKALARGFSGTSPLFVHPVAHQPDAVAVPLKSNIQCYGPWYVAGAPGHVNYEQDTGLVPWNYGDYKTMNAAGFSKVTNAVSNMDLSEEGSQELAGAPLYSLGDVLQSGGPNVTAIDVSFGSQGVTTTYRWQTYTQRFGIFTRENADRLRRLGTAAMQLRRAVRIAANNQLELAGATIAGAMAQVGWLASMPPAVQKRSTHPVIGAHVVWDNLTDPSNPTVRVAAALATVDEAIVASNAQDDPSWQATAIMSLNGLVRPVTTRAGGYGLMPGPVNPTATFGAVGLTGFGTTTNQNANSLAPFGLTHGNDLEQVACGDSYKDIRGGGRDGEDLRHMGLRAPLLLSGWGVDLSGTPTPVDPSNPGQYYPNVYNRSDKWKVGPVDFLFDSFRGVWTPHGRVLGTTTTPVPGTMGGPGMMNVSVGADVYAPVCSLPVWNWFSVDVSGNTRVMASWFPHVHAWVIDAADCTS